MIVGVGKIGSEVVSSAQSRGGKTCVDDSVVMDVCVSTFTSDGEEVWVEDDTIGGT